MATSACDLSDKQRETCAVLNMRDAVAKISNQQDIPYEEALLLFTGSPVYDALFDLEPAFGEKARNIFLLFGMTHKTKNRL